MPNEANANLVDWCVHVLGPDHVYPQDNYEAAVKYADELNEVGEKFYLSGTAPVLCFAYPCPMEPTKRSKPMTEDDEKHLTPAWTNHLTDPERERLYYMLGELGQVQDAISKVLRHGYHSTHPDETELARTNRSDLEKQLGQLRYAMLLMCINDDVNRRDIHAHAFNKSLDAARWFHYEDEHQYPDVSASD